MWRYLANVNINIALSLPVRAFTIPKMFDKFDNKNSGNDATKQKQAQSDKNSTNNDIVTVSNVGNGIDSIVLTMIEEVNQVSKYDFEINKEEQFISNVGNEMLSDKNLESIFTLRDENDDNINNDENDIEMSGNDNKNIINNKEMELFLQTLNDNEFVKEFESQYEELFAQLLLNVCFVLFFAYLYIFVFDIYDENIVYRSTKAARNKSSRIGCI